MRAYLFPLLFLSGPALAHVAPDAERTYVEARLAAAENRLDIASDRFATLLQSHQDVGLMRQALSVAVLGGDSAEAARLADAIHAASAESAGADRTRTDWMVVLTRISTAAAAGNWRAFDAARADQVSPGAGHSVTPVLEAIFAAWSTAGRKQWDAALAHLEVADVDAAAESLLMEHRAHILGLARRWPEAAEAYGAMAENAEAQVPRLRLAAAAAALEAGRRDPAWRQRGEALLADGPADDPLLAVARARLVERPHIQGRNLGGLVDSPAEGVAQLLLRIGVDLGRGQAFASALSFARFATFAAPDRPEGWLVVADLLAHTDRPTLALEALDQVAKFEAPYPELARERRAILLAREEKYPEAVALLQEIAGEPGATADDWSRLAEVQRQADNFSGAAESFGRALALLPDTAPVSQQAQLWFLRGAVHEQAGDWAAAEGDLRRAVELDSTNPVYLNYLGYSLLDRGLNFEESRDLVGKAYAAAPENGAIIDSMGWVAYVGGDYAEAVRLLQIARAAEPADPTIADHLGDALWRTGRRIEARHAWASAADLDPSAELAETLKLKREYGLDVALAGK